MFKSIEIKNLRAITELKVDNLGQVNLFVGQNNCGKTTFLESLFLLIGATNPILPVNINVFRGLGVHSNDIWPTYFHNFGHSTPIEIIGQIRDSASEQRLLIRPKYRETRVSQPLSPGKSSFVGDSKPSIELDGLELQYSDSQHPEPIVSRIFLRDNQLISEGAKERPDRGIFVSPLTEFDWKNRFDAIQARKRIPDLIAAVSKIEPRISDIRLNAIGLLVCDIGLANLIPVSLMGGGTARFLSIAMAMLESQNGVVLIDEIDNGLHYSAQATVWKAVFAWAEEFNVQVFAATHSSESVMAFSDIVDSTLLKTETKLFRIERKDEKFRAVEYTKELLAESLESKWEVR
jgi:energy-coupling factor transporter ATP-binding protein EcfA2